MKKIYTTVDVNDEIRIAVLAHDANKDATLNDMKRYFATWDGNVINFLLAILMPEIKPEESVTRLNQPNEVQKYQLITAEAVKAAAAAKAASARATAEATAVKTEIEESKIQNEAIKANIAKNQAELEHLSQLVQSARTSRQSSRQSSRAVSPTGGARATLSDASQRLKDIIMIRQYEKKVMNSKITFSSFMRKRPTHCSQTQTTKM